MNVHNSKLETPPARDPVQVPPNSSGGLLEGIKKNGRVISLILAVLGMLWSGVYFFDQKFSAVHVEFIRFDGKIDDVGNRIDTVVDSIHENSEKLARIDKRIINMEEDIDAIKKDIDNIEEKLNDSNNSTPVQAVLEF